MKLRRIFFTASPAILLVLLMQILCLWFSQALWAKTLTPPQDSTQSITYWKPHAIDAQSDPAVALAQQVFSVLLRTWDGSRVAPDLYVVRSSGGPWAASLADGNILLSRSAIDICLNFGTEKAQHLLAFILGHELAHQRADDLWHHKFLRLAGSQAPRVQQKMLQDLTFDAENIGDLEQREAQADHDGLLIMASVGYDPFQIVDQKDFFTTWVENIWQISCAAQSSDNKPSDNKMNNACAKAQTRALRTRAQLVSVATQATLFELGVQAYVAGNYPKARQYFSAYGKDYPGRAIYTNLGLSYLRQALDLQSEIIALDSKAIDFHYPLILESEPYYGPYDNNTKVVKRGDIYSAIKHLTQQKHQRIEAAIKHLEKAIRLEPNHRNAYLLLAMAYLLDDNTFMSRGILQGKYIPKFNDDPGAALLLAMTAAQEGKLEDAIKGFNDTLQSLNNRNNSIFNDGVLSYALTHNIAATLNHSGKQNRAKTAWQNLAQQARTSGNGFLFQIAVNQLANTKPNTGSHHDVNVANYQLGQYYKHPEKHQVSQDDLWLEGAKYQVVRINQSVKLIVNDKNRIISAMQLTNHSAGNMNAGASRNSKQSTTINIGDPADRPIKQFGLPSRRVHLMSGQYLAYDNLGLAVHTINGVVTGWFLYDPT